MQDGSGAIEEVITPRKRALVEGFSVRRALPYRRRRMVGPFAFLDEMGPATLKDGFGLDVPPHPHIGLATLTWLFEGALLHRDGLGSIQTIRPGEVNWMVAGRGIAHSERTPPELRRDGEQLHGLQCWIALPKANEEIEPAFFHHASAAIPRIRRDGADVCLVAGRLLGEASPVKTFSDTVFADVALEAGARFEVPAEHEARAIYVVTGTLTLGEASFTGGQLVVLSAGPAVPVEASGAARFVLLGGAPLDGPRHIWWNFVSSDPARIERAKADWREGRFAPVIGETEALPLPSEPPPPVRYP